MFCIGIATPLEISMIENVLGMSSIYYGFGNAVEGLGMLLASIFIIGVIKKLYPEYIIMLGFFSAAFSYLIIGLADNVWFHIRYSIFGSNLLCS